MTRGTASGVRHTPGAGERVKLNGHNGNGKISSIL
jgi:hypothetical protein